MYPKLRAGRPTATEHSLGFPGREREREEGGRRRGRGREGERAGERGRVGGEERERDECFSERKRKQ